MRTRCARLNPIRISTPALPVQFLQSMEPKLDAESLAPVSWPREPSLEWCPPGHGDVYSSLRSSGMLVALLERNFHYAMISNADNLGASIDVRIAAHMERGEIPFLMEVVEGTEADRKGGHIARRRADGQLVLRETAQTPPEDEESFRDYRRWRYYNTEQPVGRSARAEGEARPDRWRARASADRQPQDRRSTRLEFTARAAARERDGAAIGSFKDARLLCVPRTRFVPVKTTDDLLVLRSDLYTLSDDLAVRAVPERVSSLPYVELDPDFYKLLEDFEKRFPDGPASLREADRLVVHGDVTFGAGVRVRGSVELDVNEPVTIEAGTTLEP